MLSLIALSVLLLAVAIFALENAQAVTVRFLFWQLQSSMAVVTIAATAAGVLIAGLVGLASRLRRWKRGRAATGAAHPAILPSEPRSPAGSSSRRRGLTVPIEAEESGLGRDPSGTRGGPVGPTSNEQGG